MRQQQTFSDGQLTSNRPPCPSTALRTTSQEASPSSNTLGEYEAPAPVVAVVKSAGLPSPRTERQAVSSTTESSTRTLFSLCAALSAPPTSRRVAMSSQQGFAFT